MLEEILGVIFSRKSCLWSTYWKFVFERSIHFYPCRTYFNFVVNKILFLQIGQSKFNRIISLWEDEMATLSANFFHRFWPLFFFIFLSRPFLFLSNFYFSFDLFSLYVSVLFPIAFSQIKIPIRVLSTPKTF